MFCPHDNFTSQCLPLIFAIAVVVPLIRVLPNLWLCKHFLGNDTREAFGWALVCKTVEKGS